MCAGIKHVEQVCQRCGHTEEVDARRCVGLCYGSVTSAGYTQVDIFLCADCWVSFNTWRCAGKEKP